MSGDFNADIFVFADGHGNDIIRDFDAQNDLERIDLSLLSSLNNFDALLAATRQSGHNLIIETDHNTSITLLGVDLVNLSLEDFIF